MKNDLPLLDFVLSELRARKGTWPQVCADTGLDYSWLSKLASGAIANPGINSVQTLADYFKSTLAA